MGNKNKTMPTSFRGFGWRKLESVDINETLYAGTVCNFGYNRTNAGDRPMYKRFIRLGLNAFNPMIVTVSNGEVDDLNHEFRIASTKNTPNGIKPCINSWGYNGVPTIFAPLVLSALQGTEQPLVKACAIANRVLHKKWTARRSQFQGGVVLAELGKTLSMVIKPAKTLRQKVTTLTSRLTKVRKRAGRGPSAVKVMADTWLETTFGWRPLIADVKDGATAVARVATRDALERQQFRAYGRYEYTVQVSTGNDAFGCVNGANVLNFSYTDDTKRIGECIIYGKWQTKLQDATATHSAAQRLATLSGFNWADVAPQVWEVIPYSFLIDYFTNVGDVISAACNVFDQPAWMVEVDIDSVERSRHWTPNKQAQLSQYGPFISYDGGDVARKSSYKVVDRNSFEYDKLYPTLSFSLPVDMQWLNIAALVAGGRSFQAFTH